MTTIGLPSITPGVRAIRPARHAAAAPVAPETAVAPETGRRPSLVQRLASLVGTVFMVLAVVHVLVYGIAAVLVGSSSS